MCETNTMCDMIVTPGCSSKKKIKIIIIIITFENTHRKTKLETLVHFVFPPNFFIVDVLTHTKKKI